MDYLEVRLDSEILFESPKSDPKGLIYIKSDIKLVKGVKLLMGVELATGVKTATGVRLPTGYELATGNVDRLLHLLQNCMIHWPNPLLLITVLFDSKKKYIKEKSTNCMTYPSYCVIEIRA